MQTFNIAGLSVEVPLHVYPPSEDTFILMRLLSRHAERNLAKIRCKRLLEVGCGSGLVAIYARKLFSPNIVFVTDLSIKAINATKRNILRNGEDIKDYFLINTDICHCFSSSAEFDYALINPPYLPHDSTWASSDPIKPAVEGGPTGVEILNSFLTEVIERLSSIRIAYVYSSHLAQLIETDSFIQHGYEIQDRIDEVFSDETLTAVMWVRSS